MIPTWQIAVQSPAGRRTAPSCGHISIRRAQRARQKTECIGRSKSGLSTKIHATCDAVGNPTGVHLTPGQPAIWMAPTFCWTRSRRAYCSPTRAATPKAAQTYCRSGQTGTETVKRRLSGCLCGTCVPTGQSPTRDGRRATADRGRRYLLWRYQGWLYVRQKRFPGRVESYPWRWQNTHLACEKSNLKFQDKEKYVVNQRSKSA